MSNTLTIPEPLPADGYRELSPFEMMQRQLALTCIRSRESAQCQGQVYATLFFDGTHNNMDWKEPGTPAKQQDLGKHSNIAKLMRRPNACGKCSATSTTGTPGPRRSPASSD